VNEFGMGNLASGSGSNQRLPVVLCLDTSESMKKTDASDRIGELNQAVKAWKKQLSESAQVRRQADICVITFNTLPTTVDCGGGTAPGFVSVDRFSPPTFTASGVTRLELAIEAAIAKAEEHSRASEIETHRAKIWVISDGAPTDAEGNYPSDVWRTVLPRVRAGESARDFALFAAGVYGADMDVLKELAGAGAFDLRGLPLERVLKTVTDSLTANNHGTAGRRADTVDAEKADVASTVAKQKRIFEMLGRSG
jgi:uncharacterized protein YegL